jgi:hypothetical protein
MTKNRRAQAREGVGGPAAGRDGDGDRYGGGVKDRPAVSVAVMPLWDRPRPGVCR